VASIWKALAIMLYGEWNRLEVAGYHYFALAKRSGPRMARAISRTHQPLLVSRLLASVALLLGYGSQIAILVIAIALIVELGYEYRFNTIYMLLCLLCLLPSGSLGSGVHLSDQLSSKNTWSQVLIVLLTIDLYINSAWLKIKSPQFITGRYLSQLATVSGAVRHRLPLWEYHHPALLVRAAQDNRSRLLWRLAATATVLLEATIPIGLLIPSTRPWAFAAGIGLHLAFLGILPIRLLPFTMTTLASYALFAP
jgi:hypothetical protein